MLNFYYWAAVIISSVFSILVCKTLFRVNSGNSSNHLSSSSRDADVSQPPYTCSTSSPGPHRAPRERAVPGRPGWSPASLGLRVWCAGRRLKKAFTDLFPQWKCFRRGPFQAPRWSRRGAGKKRAPRAPAARARRLLHSSALPSECNFGAKTLIWQLWL